MVKFFIDSNILANFIILNSIIKTKKINVMSTKYSRFKESYNLVKKILLIKNNKFFFNSILSRTELYCAVLDEYKIRKLFLEGVPLSTWQRMKNDIFISKEEINDIKKAVSTFIEENLSQEGSDREKGAIESLLDPYDFNHIADLVFNNGLRTHDAILISTAVNNGLNFFVTSDSSIKNKIKGIEVIKPKTALEKIKKMKL